MVHEADQNEATQAHAPQALMPDTTASLTLDGCVCPQCYKPLKAPAVTDGGDTRYGRRTRSYAGMCFQCSRGCRVVQFEQDGRWVIHSYLLHRYESGAFVGIGDWIEVNPLPEPPAVLNGPGGDFDEVPDPSYDPSFAATQGAAALLRQATNAIGELLKAIEKLRHNEPDKRKH